MAGIIVFVGGGAMAGVYSAGVLDALTTLGVRDEVEAIYGVSAGAFNAANFATREMHNNLIWYAEHASHNQVIKSTNPFRSLIGEEVLDVAGASRLIAEHHLLDVAALASCATPTYFGVVDEQTKEFVWKDARRDDALTLLRATASLVPFTKESVALDGRHWVDGGYAQSVALTSLRSRHPGKKLILILNTRFDEFSLKRLAGYLIVRFHDAALAQSWHDSIEHGKKELADAIAADDVVVFRPDIDFPVEIVTTDVATVKQGYALGVAAVEKNAVAMRVFIDADDFPMKY